MFATFLKYGSLLVCRLHLPKRTENTYGKDLAAMLKKRYTFQEALSSDIFRVMSKQRLKIMQRSIYEQLELAI